MFTLTLLIWMLLVIMSFMGIVVPQMSGSESSLIYYIKFLNQFEVKFIFHMVMIVMILFINKQFEFSKIKIFYLILLLFFCLLSYRLRTNLPIMFLAGILMLLFFPPKFFYKSMFNNLQVNFNSLSYKLILSKINYLTLDHLFIFLTFIFLLFIKMFFFSNVVLCDMITDEIPSDTSKKESDNLSEHSESTVTISNSVSFSDFDFEAPPEVLNKPQEVSCMNNMNNEICNDVAGPSTSSSVDNSCINPSVAKYYELMSRQVIPDGPTIITVDDSKPPVPNDLKKVCCCLW